MAVEIEPNKYTIRMWSSVKAKELYEYKVYAHSEEEAVEKLLAGNHQGVITPIETVTGDIESDYSETIEVIGCEQGAIS